MISIFCNYQLRKKSDGISIQKFSNKKYSAQKLVFVSMFLLFFSLLIWTFFFPSRTGNNQVFILVFVIIPIIKVLLNNIHMMSFIQRFASAYHSSNFTVTMWIIRQKIVMFCFLCISACDSICTIIGTWAFGKGTRFE